MVLLPAGAIAVPPSLYVKMKVVAVVGIIARPKHGRKIVAALGAHGVEQAPLAERKEARATDVDLTAVLERNAHDVDRIALGML